jgi:hypothetical protein
MRLQKPRLPAQQPRAVVPQADVMSPGIISTVIEIKEDTKEVSADESRLAAQQPRAAEPLAIEKSPGHLATEAAEAALAHLGLTWPHTTAGPLEDLQLDPTLSSQQRKKFKRSTKAIFRSGDYALLDDDLQGLLCHLLSIVPG